MVDLVSLNRYRGSDRRQLFEDLTQLSPLVLPLAGLSLGRFLTGSWIWPGAGTDPARGVALRLTVGLPDIGPVREGMAEAFGPGEPDVATQPEPTLLDPEQGVLDGGRLASGAQWVVLLARLTPEADPSAVQLTLWQHPGRTAMGATVLLLAPRLDPRPHQQELLAAAERLHDDALPRRARIGLATGAAVLRRTAGGQGLDAMADEEFMRARALRDVAAQLPADAVHRSLGLVRLRPAGGVTWWQEEEVLTVMAQSPPELLSRPLPQPRSARERWLAQHPEPLRLTRRQLAGGLASRLAGGAIAGLAGFAVVMGVVQVGSPSGDAVRAWGTFCLLFGGALVVLGLVLAGPLEWRPGRTHPLITALTGLGGFLLVVAAATPVAVHAR